MSAKMFGLVFWRGFEAGRDAWVLISAAQEGRSLPIEVTVSLGSTCLGGSGWRFVVWALLVTYSLSLCALVLLAAGLKKYGAGQGERRARRAGCAGVLRAGFSCG